MHNKVKYAICYIYCSIGEATENNHIVWLTDSPLAWVTDLEDATFWEDKALAEVSLSQAKDFVYDKSQVLNVVSVNWYEESEECDE